MFHHHRGRWFPLAEPVTTANARIEPAILDGACPPAPALSFAKSACAFVRAWLTSDVRRKWKEHMFSALPRHGSREAAKAQKS